MLGEELLDVIHRYPDHVWVFLHEFPALTGERAEQFRERRRAYERRVEAVLRGRRRVRRVPRRRPVADRPGLARHAQLHVPVAEAGRPAVGPRRGQAVRRHLHARHRPARAAPVGLRAPSSRRRRRSPSRSSSATRRSRGTSTRPTRSAADPSPSGCLAAIASIASCGSSSWIAERNVPGHTQFTRMPSRAYSTAATFASWITAAFVAQYGRGVRPRGEPRDRGGQHDRARPLRRA